MKRLRIPWALARVYLALRLARWAERLLDEPKPKKERVYQLDGVKAVPLSEVQVIYARRLPAREALWFAKLACLGIREGARA